MARGTVSKLLTKDWDGPRGQVVLHSFLLGGDKAYYRTGSTDPAKLGIVEGKVVSFDVDYKGNVVAQSVRVLGDGVVERGPAVPQRSAPVTASKDSYWENKEARDLAKDERYQSVDIPRMTYCGAQDNAVKIVELAIANGGITLPAKKGAILEAIIGAVEEVALTLAKSRMSAPELLGAASLVENDTPVAEDTDGGYD